MVCRLLLETGRGAAWLAHLLWEQRVAGSNPVAPTKRNCREDPLKLGLRGFFVFGGESGPVWPNPAESVKKGCFWATFWATF
jgi:hypothetical protein